MHLSTERKVWRHQMQTLKFWCSRGAGGEEEALLHFLIHTVPSGMASVGEQGKACHGRGHTMSAANAAISKVLILTMAKRTNVFC